MAYIARKPCRFDGRDFRVGETVPEALVAREARKRLLSSGILATADEPAKTQPAPRPDGSRKQSAKEPGKSVKPEAGEAP